MSTISQRVDLPHRYITDARIPASKRCLRREGADRCDAVPVGTPECLGHDLGSVRPLAVEEDLDTDVARPI